MKNKLRDERRSAAVGMAIIIAVMVIVFGSVFYWMYTVDLLFLPSFVEKWLGLDGDGDEIPWELGTLSSLVKNGKDESGETVTFDITYENLLAALLAKDAEDGVYLSAEVDYYTDGIPYTRRIVYRRFGERYRIELYRIERSDDMTAPVLESLKIADSETLYVFDSATGESRFLMRDMSIAPESEAGMPSIETLFETLAHFPESQTDDVAENGVTDTVLKLVRTDAGNVYYIAFTYAGIGLREEYYVSLDYRMIISMESRQNGVPVYSYRTTEFSVDSREYTRDLFYDISKAQQQ